MGKKWTVKVTNTDGTEKVIEAREKTARKVQGAAWVSADVAKVAANPPKENS